MGLPTNESNASAQAEPFEIVRPTPEQRDQVVDLVSKSLEERPGYRQFFGNRPGMMRNAVLMQLGSAYDNSKSPDSGNKSNCEVWAIGTDGRIQSVVAFNDPTKDYGADVSEYETRLGEQVYTEESLKWEGDHWRPAWNLLKSQVDKQTDKPAIDIMDMYTRSESRGLGYGTTLLEKVKSISKDRNIQTEIVTDNERNLDFFKKRGLQQIAQVDLELDVGTHQLTAVRLPTEEEST